MLQPSQCRVTEGTAPNKSKKFEVAQRHVDLESDFMGIILCEWDFLHRTC